jgi:hypothetical protein
LRAVPEASGNLRGWLRQADDDPLQAHVDFVSEMGDGEDESGATGAACGVARRCAFVDDHGAAYKALARGEIQMTLVPTFAAGSRAEGRSAAAKAAGRAGAHAAVGTSQMDDEAFEEALVRLERVSQRLVVEQQYGQRLEALTSSLVSKIQSWVVRLRKEEASRNQLKETLELLRERKQQQQQQQQQQQAAGPRFLFPTAHAAATPSPQSTSGR